MALHRNPEAISLIVRGDCFGRKPTALAMTFQRGFTHDFLQMRLPYVEY